MMKLFSERFGYTKPSEVIIREQLTEEIQNAICSCYDHLKDSLDKYSSEHYCESSFYAKLEEHLWEFFLNKRAADFYTYDYRYHIVSTDYISTKSNPWFKKLDLIEMSIKYLRLLSKKEFGLEGYVDNFISALNKTFERLNFAYQIVNDEIVEISSKDEIQSIETALDESPHNIRIHLNNALELYAKRPVGDYRNSIKESISAVEAWCRAKTGASDLGAALSNLEKKGITLHPILKKAFDKLYAYTNQPDTGSRHALMDDTDTYTPKAEEAMFMLVSCSAFINYLNRKI